jgi:pyridoxal phosphate enzyme (YggS family)
MTESQADVSVEGQTTLIAQRLDTIRQTIPATVRLIAVTKQMPLQTIRAAYAAGLRDFGENRLQEAIAKQQELQDLPDITWHLIGHLQSNKAGKALEHFHWIHSVDSLKLAQRLDALAEGMPHSPSLLLQVKLRPDPGKFGWEVEELLQDLPLLDQCCHLKILGLMTILPYGLSAEENFAAFCETRKLAEMIQQQGFQRIHMQQLSMGMSEDYLQAVAAGATMIRLGRILFGDRPAKT